MKEKTTRNGKESGHRVERDRERHRDRDRHRDRQRHRGGGKTAG